MFQVKNKRNAEPFTSQRIFLNRSRLPSTQKVEIASSILTGI